jgi:hypothetical protein
VKVEGPVGSVEEALRVIENASFDGVLLDANLRGQPAGQPLPSRRAQLDSDPATLVRLAEEMLERTRGRPLAADETREALRLASRAKWMRKHLDAHDDTSRRLRALESELSRALKRA